MFSNLNKAGIDVVTDRKMQDNSGMIEFKEKERHQHCYLSLKKYIISRHSTLNTSRIITFLCCTD